MFCIIFTTSRKTADTQPTQVSTNRHCSALLYSAELSSYPSRNLIPERHYPYYTINKLIGLIVSCHELSNRSYHICVMITATSVNPTYARRKYCTLAADGRTITSLCRGPGELGKIRKELVQTSERVNA